MNAKHKLKLRQKGASRVITMQDEKLYDGTGLPHIEYQDAERIIVSFNHLSEPLTREVEKAKAAPPYFRVWIDATMDELLTPSPKEEAAETLILTLFLSPLFEPGLGLELGRDETRRVGLRVTCHNYINIPEWFWTLKKRSLPMFFEHCQVDGRQARPILATDDSFTLRHLGALPESLSALVFPFMAGPVIFTDTDRSMQRLLTFVTDLWNKKLPGHREPLSATFKCWLQAPKTKPPKALGELMPYFNVSLWAIGKYFPSNNFLDCPIELVRESRKIFAQLIPLLAERDNPVLENLICSLDQAIARSAHADETNAPALTTKKL